MFRRATMNRNRSVVFRSRSARDHDNDPGDRDVLTGRRRAARRAPRSAPPEDRDRAKPGSPRSGSVEVGPSVRPSRSSGFVVVSLLTMRVLPVLQRPKVRLSRVVNLCATRDTPRRLTPPVEFSRSAIDPTRSARSRRRNTPRGTWPVSAASRDPDPWSRVLPRAFDCRRRRHLEGQNARARRSAASESSRAASRRVDVPRLAVMVRELVGPATLDAAVQRREGSLSPRRVCIPGAAKCLET